MKVVQVRIATGVVSGVFFFGLYWCFPSLFICLLASLSCWMVLVEWARVQGTPLFWYQVPPMATIIYPVLPLALLLLHVIQWRQAMPFYALYPFVAAWIVDVAAYFVGSLCGSHRCFPSISPAKTWEGVAGGIGGLALMHMLIWAVGATVYPWWFMLLSSFCVAIAAIMGDLLMSWFKRQQGLKDTGVLLPGHGGLLDRFDSVLTVIVVVKLCELVLSL